jgi:DNA-directed RNA polymerase specialized sigma24 family protein
MFANVRRQRLPTPSTIVVDRKMLHRVLRLVAKPQRRLIQMKYLDNLSAAEIAAALGMSLDSVNQAVSRAKRALGKELSDRPDLMRELRKSADV